MELNAFDPLGSVTYPHHESIFATRRYLELVGDVLNDS
jgi:hypothetical protein